MTSVPLSGGSIGLTQAQLAAAIGVNPASITNWRKRHSDFPERTRTDDGTWIYDSDAVLCWLAAREGGKRTTIAGKAYSERLRDHLDRRPVTAAIRDVAEVDPALLRGLEALRSSEFRSIERACFIDAVLLLACVWAVDQQTWDGVEACRGSTAEMGRWIDPLLRERGAGFGAAEILDPLRSARAGGVRTLVTLCGRLGVRGFDQVLESFGKWLGADSDSYRTPAEVAALMAACVPEDGSGPLTAFDPYSRGTELLLAGDERWTVKAVGMTAAAARRGQLGLLIHGVPGTVAPPRRRAIWRLSDSGERFDVVLTNPPFRQRLDELDRDTWIFGTPPENRADLAWMQLALERTADTGTAVVLMSAAAAVPGDQRSRKILETVVDSGALRAVVRLPSSLFPVTSVDTMIWVLGHPDAERSRVVFVDATRLLRKAHQQRRPQLVGTEAIADVVTGRVLLGDRAIELVAAGPDSAARGGAIAVPVAEIADQGYLLTPDSYLGRAEPQDPGSGIHAAARRFTTAARRVATCHEPASVVVRRGPRAHEDRDAGWQSRRLGDLCEIRTGQSVLHGVVLDTAARVGPIVLRARDVRARRIAADSAARLTGRCSYLPTLTVSAGDLLFVRAGQVGEVGMVSHPVADALFDSNLLRLRPDPRLIDPGFLLEYLLCAATRDQINAIATVNTVPSIGAGRLGQLVVDLPPMPEQRAVVAVLEAHEQRLSAMRAALDAAVDLREQVASGLLAGAVVAE